MIPASLMGASHLLSLQLSNPASIGKECCNLQLSTILGRGVVSKLAFATAARSWLSSCPLRPAPRTLKSQADSPDAPLAASVPQLPDSTAIQHHHRHPLSQGVQQVHQTPLDNLALLELPLNTARGSRSKCGVLPSSNQGEGRAWSHGHHTCA